MSDTPQDKDPKTDDKIERLSSAMELADRVFKMRMQNYRRMKKMMDKSVKEELEIIEKIKGMF